MISTNRARTHVICPPVEKSFCRRRHFCCESVSFFPSPSIWLFPLPPPPISAVLVRIPYFARRKHRSLWYRLSVGSSNAGVEPSAATQAPLSKGTLLHRALFNDDLSPAYFLSIHGHPNIYVFLSFFLSFVSYILVN